MFLASGLMAAPFLLMQRLPREGWPQAVRLRCFLQEMKGTRRMALLVLLGRCTQYCWSMGWSMPKTIFLLLWGEDFGVNLLLV